MASVLDLREVRDEWDAIGESWAAVRQRPWPAVLQYIDGLPAGARILDVGCGGGRHGMPMASDGREVHGVDISRRILGVYAERAAKETVAARIAVGSATHLPYRDGVFDHAIAVAVLHHLPSAGARIAALTEARRVLAPGGTCFVTVWARAQPRFAATMAKDALLYPLRKARDPSYSYGDTTVPWPVAAGRRPRFYHLFTRRELTTLSKRAGFFVKDVWSEAFTGGSFDDNHLALLQKPAEPKD